MWGAGWAGGQSLRRPREKTEGEDAELRLNISCLEVPGHPQLHKTLAVLTLKRLVYFGKSL